MRRSLGFLMAGLLVFLFFLVAPAFTFDRVGLADRSNENDTEELSAIEAVAGQTYFGEFTNSCGSTATSCMAFDDQGNIEWDQDFGGGPFVFYGTYDENAFGPFSLWAASFADGSPNGEFSIAGVAVGPILFMRLSNTDESCPDQTPLTARGIYRNTPCTPGQRVRAIGRSGEDVVAGLPFP
jgi:hypothetical protein